MIKKLLSVVLFVSTVGVANSFAQSNCTPDISCVPADSTFGICPDSATGLPAGQIGTAYNVTMSIKVPGSTVAFGQTVTVSHLALTDVLVDTSTTGTPAYVSLTNIGLDYLGSGDNTPTGASGISGTTMTKYCYWDAPGTTCVVVSGTPTKAGTFPVRIKSYGRAVIFGQGTWNPAPDNDDYKFVVAPNGTIGIETNDMSKFAVAQNTPNPFNEKTEINFTSPNVTDVDFKVYNVVGAVVYNTTVKADKGANTITLNANSFAPGAYMYAIKNGNQVITKRMIVTQ
jgi:hypothetical protein